MVASESGSIASVGIRRLSFQLHQFAANSIHYLLTFWQRMVSSMPYVKSSEPHLLEQFAPLVTKAYIESRLNLVSSVVRSVVFNLAWQ